MKTDNSGKSSKRTILPILTIVFGLIVLVYGVVVEDEPTAVALLLIVGGAIWFFIARYRQRSQSRTQ